MFLALLTALCFTTQPQTPSSLYAPDNLMAWCIVPFDSQKRGPVERVAMLQKLGFTKYAYDWRAEHLPTFDLEISELKKHHIELSAVWFPAGLNKDALFILDALKRHSIKTQLWIMITDPAPGGDQAAKVKAAAGIIRPIADAAGKIGCRVSLYNHGGWGGEPENQLVVINALQLPNVGIVYNLHHGHDHVNRFPELLQKMLPKLDAVNLNGMEQRGDRNNRKILVLGHGDNDLSLLKAVQKSGYRGPIGILGHTNDDVEQRLADNLAGLNWLRPQLTGQTASTRPQTRTQDPAPKHTVRLSDDGQSITVTGSPKSVTVVVANGTEAEITARPPIPGVSKTAGTVLVFTPKYPLTPGVKYRVAIGDYHVDVTVPKPKIESTTTVQTVYPTGNTLPENALRFYIHFSQPMTRGDVYQHIKLIGEDGKAVAFPFLELDEELWSADGKRFTLLFDPGRVKRGLKPREEVGPSLIEGKKYTLVIDRAWEDGNGAPMKETFRKSFSVTPPDDDGVEPNNWKFTSTPRAATRQKLAVNFGTKPLDHALVQRMIWVTDAAGNKVEGTVHADEHAWDFTPVADWKAGAFKLVIDTRLEDACGNRVRHPFEIDVFKPVTKKIDGKTVDLPFVVK